MHFKAIAVLSLCAALAAGCAGQAHKDLSAAQSTTPRGSEFNKNLHKEYVAIAQRELKEADPESATYYSQKAIAAAEGKAVRPDDFSDYKVHPNYEKDLRAARTRLVAALGSPAAALKPAAAAKA
jgi:OOP family OmpA-OmpF porin